MTLIDRWANIFDVAIFYKWQRFFILRKIGWLVHIFGCCFLKSFFRLGLSTFRLYNFRLSYIAQIYYQAIFV